MIFYRLLPYTSYDRSCAKEPKSRFINFCIIDICIHKLSGGDKILSSLI